MWRHDVNGPSRNRLHYGGATLPSRPYASTILGLMHASNVIHLDYKYKHVEVTAYAPLADHLLILMSSRANKRDLTPEETHMAYTPLKASPLDNFLVSLELWSLCHLASTFYDGLSPDLQVISLVLVGTHVEGLLTGLLAWNASKRSPRHHPRLHRRRERTLRGYPWSFNGTG